MVVMTAVDSSFHIKYGTVFVCCIIQLCKYEAQCATLASIKFVKSRGSPLMEYLCLDLKHVFILDEKRSF